MNKKAESPNGDLLIIGGAYLLSGGWRQGGYALIKDGKIAELSPKEPSEELKAGAGSVISADGMAVLPGLINAHTHFGQTFMRGLAGGRPLLPWLKERIWPLQEAFGPEEMELAAQLGLLENLRCGVTKVTDHHKITKENRYADIVCTAAEQAGIRLTLARSWTDLEPGGERPEAVLDDLKSLFGRWKGSRFVTIANGPLAAWRCGAETLQKSHALARENNSFTHIHVSEVSEEVRKSRESYDLPPIAWLDSLGILDSRMQLVHCVWAEPDEIERIARSESTMIHCPVSNAVLGSGIAPLKRFIENKIPILLGTDGPASNDTQDLIETMKSALLFARSSELDVEAVSPDQVLSMAVGGKRLEAGAPADLILIDLENPRSVPVHDYTSALTLGTHGSDVATVIIDGRILIQDKKCLFLDESALLSECGKAAKKLKKRAGLD